MIHFHKQRFNFIDFMVIELRFFKKKKKKKMKNMGKNVKSTFCVLLVIKINKNSFIHVLLMEPHNPISD